ncbi:hypothetical protein HK102_003416 [Quaeritorhiza haematococci]|nr:hypothetical protein HK102_003416 [Quaeritorhiza haematococci]
MKGGQRRGNGGKQKNSRRKGIGHKRRKKGLLARKCCIAKDAWYELDDDPDEIDEEEEDDERDAEDESDDDDGDVGDDA